MKSNLITFPILHLPDFSKQFILYTDASSYAIGVILGQLSSEGEEIVINYYSRALKGSEIHYSFAEKECLGVVAEVKVNRYYLDGTHFVIYTDHVALKWLMSIKEPTGRLVRWAIYLQAFDFEKRYKKGFNHTNVDAISRPVLASEVMLERDYAEINRDIYSNKHLLEYLRSGKHENGASNKRVKGIEKEVKNYKLINDIVYFKKDNEKTGGKKRNYCSSSPSKAFWR